MSDELTQLSDDQKVDKIQSLREMITSAERTIHSAKAMLLQIEGKKKAGRKRKLDDSDDGQVIQGTFDGQVMIGVDGRQYPVPANYASKSKLVEGDLLKLTITPEGQFLYKQIGPVPRINKVGILGQDSAGNYFAAVDDKNYKVLLASVTYFKAEPGDEIVVVVSQEEDTFWASIENVLRQNADPSKAHVETAPAGPQTASAILTGTGEAPVPIQTHTTNEQALVDEWVPDIDEIEREIREEMGIKQPEQS